MKRILVLVVLLFAVAAVAQTQDNKQTPPPKAGASQQMKAPMSNAEVQRHIQSTYDTDPQFSTARLSTEVTDKAVIVSGQVSSVPQRQAAYAVAKKWAGKRKIEARVTSAN